MPSLNSLDTAQHDVLSTFCKVNTPHIFIKFTPPLFAHLVGVSSVHLKFAAVEVQRPGVHLTAFKSCKRPALCTRGVTLIENPTCPRRKKEAMALWQALAKAHRVWSAHNGGVKSPAHRAIQRELLTIDPCMPEQRLAAVLAAVR